MYQQAIITGASRGIGHALSLKLIAHGYYVIGTSRTGSIDGIDDEAFRCMELDVTKDESRVQFVKRLKEANTQVDLFINNAGIGPDLEFLLPEKTSFEQTFHVNVNGVVMLTESIIPIMNKGGCILNVSSKMGSLSNCQGSDAVAYRMSKSALNMYTKILANRLEVEKIKVASIHPGWVQTTITESCINGRLTPQESATRIFEYLQTRLSNGDFWDAEDGVQLDW